MSGGERAVDRRLAELGRSATVILRRPAAAVVRVGDELFLLDGRRLVADPAHTGLRLVGGDLALKVFLEAAC
jgi:hypothetical protein